MVAAFKMRATPVNVNYRYVEDELRYLLTDSGATAIVLHRSLAPRLGLCATSCPSCAGC